MKKKLTIKDVAKHADVSIATVSRVINNRQWASKEARKKVMHAIEELGYTPNALARGLVSHKSNTVGILMPDVSNYFFAEVFRGMEDAVHERGSNVLVCNTDMKKERMLKYLTFLQEKQADGIIFASERVTEDYHEIFQQSGIPVVLLATEAPSSYGLPTVKVNDYQASKDAVHYLVKKGHRQIAMISGPMDDLVAGFPRFQGYQAALMENGIPFNEELVTYGDFRFDSGREAAKQLLENHPEITAVFCGSDEMACGAIVQALKMGFRVPEEFSVMGYDNVKMARMIHPSLTTLAQPLYDMGQKAANLLFQFIQCPDDKKQDLCKTFYMDHQIVERESVSSR
ncbi:MAG TPA: substrate-binding domain-containing protein [Bacillales bacterium]|nr:substrate-binding domain-containing protein [Bacillales bacterium]